MPCPNLTTLAAKQIGSAVMTLGQANRQLTQARARFAKKKGDCVVYWSEGDSAWVRVSPSGPGMVRLELVNASNCPC
jgi:hypothetical protein